MYKYILDENQKKTAVILSIKEFEDIQKKLIENKEKIEALENALDIKLADDIMKSKEEIIPFKASDYV